MKNYKFTIICAQEKDGERLIGSTHIDLEAKNEKEALKKAKKMKKGKIYHTYRISEVDEGPKLMVKAQQEVQAKALKMAERLLKK